MLVIYKTREKVYCCHSRFKKKTCNFMSAAYVKKGCLMTAGTLYLWAVSPPFRLSISISNSSNKLVAPLGWSFGRGGWLGGRSCRGAGSPALHSWYPAGEAVRSWRPVEIEAKAPGLHSGSLPGCSQPLVALVFLRLSASQTSVFAGRSVGTSRALR